jgi:hypothetical protein
MGIQFLDRQHEHLQSFWSKPLDMQRAYSLNPKAIKSWFDMIEEFVVKAGIDRALIYGMDKSGFPTAYPGKDRVIGKRGTKTQHKQGGADQENVCNSGCHNLRRQHHCLTSCYL